jgi:hypothetical protein
MKVAIVTENQKNLLVGQSFNQGSYFNPVQDADDNWVISYEEIQQCNNPSFWWIKDLTLIDYNRKPVDLSTIGL